MLKLERGVHLDAADRATLARLSTQPYGVAAGQDISRAGEPIRAIHLVTQGLAFRYRLLEQGARQIVGILVPGDFCDIQAHVLGRADHYVAALTDCAVTEIPLEVADELSLTRSTIARAMWWATLVDESILRAWLTTMGRMEAPQRLAHLFCELFLRLRASGLTEGTTCALPMTQEFIADTIGITGVHANRVLQDLRGRSLVVVRNRILDIPNLRALQDFCGFDPTYLHGLADPRP